MKKEVILALDYGTQSVKCLAFDPEGNLLDLETENYPWISEKNDYLEIDPELQFKKAEETVRRTVEKLPGSDFKAISFSYFGHGCLLVDENYEPLTNNIILADNRAKEVKDELLARGADEKFREVTGFPYMSSCIPARVYWFKKNRRDIFDKAAAISDIQLYTLKRLELEPVNDGTMASCFTLIDVHTHKKSEELMDIFEIPHSWISDEFVTADHVCGYITKFGDVELGSQMAVMPGAHDTDCGILGLGAIPEFPGIVSNSMGTYQQCGFLYTGDEETVEKKGKAFFNTKCGSYYEHGNVTSSGGSAMTWFINTFCEGKPIYDELFEKVTFDASNRLLFSNAFSSSKAKVGNMNLTTKREDIFGALIEGITFSLAKGYDKLNAEMLKENGSPITEMRVTGGASKADKYLQLMADVYDMKVIRCDHVQGTGGGAAMIAAVGAGIFKDYKEATEHMVNLTDAFYPDKERHEKYLKRLDDFLEFKG